MEMRRGIDWLLILVGVLLVVGLIAYARGPEHYRGDEVCRDGDQGSGVAVARPTTARRWLTRARS
jgi:hypothetical protein